MEKKETILDKLKTLYPTIIWDMRRGIRPNSFTPFIKILADGRVVAKIPVEVKQDLMDMNSEETDAAMEKFIIGQIEIELVEYGLPPNNSKSLDVENIKDAAAKINDIKVVGNGDLFQLICKASSKEQGWMKSTKAMQIDGVGCVIQVTTQQGDNVAEALTFVPGVRIDTDINGNKGLYKISPLVDNGPNGGP